MSTSYGWYGTLAGRLGLAADRTLIYLRGGLAWTDNELQAGVFTGGVVDPEDVTRRSEVEVGWTLGRGIEHALEPRWTVKAEYLYMDDFGDHGTTNEHSEFYTTEHQLHTVKAGLNYKF